jgi:tetratricopeptide (TPR) repeat protein
LLSDIGYSDESLWFNNWAEKYYRRNYSTSNFERKHITIQSNYATTLIQAGRVDEAKAIQEKILADASERGMRDDDEVLVVASNYAHVLHVTGDLHRAYEVYRDTAERTARVHGKSHHDSIRRRANELCLALVVGDQHVEEADFIDIARTARSLFGPDHRTTHVSMHNLGGYYEKKGDLHKAIAIFSEMLASMENTEGEEAIETLRVMESCARVRSKMKEYTTAQSLYSTCFSRAYRRYGPLNPITLDCLHGWVASSLESSDDNTLEVPFKIVLRAFAMHDKPSEVRHSQHDRFLKLYLLHMYGRGASPDEVLSQYRRILNENSMKGEL